MSDVLRSVQSMKNSYVIIGKMWGDNATTSAYQRYPGMLHFLDIVIDDKSMQLRDLLDLTAAMRYQLVKLESSRQLNKRASSLYK